MFPDRRIANRSGWKDSLLLISVAILVCVGGVGSFLMADSFKVNDKWIVIGLNSIGFIAIIWGRFKTFSPRPSVVFFFMAWLVIHGFLAFLLSLYLPFLYWIPIYMLEFAIGFRVASSLFPTEGA